MVFQPQHNSVGSSVRFVDTVFAGNHAVMGGAVFISTNLDPESEIDIPNRQFLWAPTFNVLFSGCNFSGNVASDVSVPAPRMCVCLLQFARCILCDCSV